MPSYFLAFVIDVDSSRDKVRLFLPYSSAVTDFLNEMRSFKLIASFEAFTSMMFQVEVFRVVTPHAASIFRVKWPVYYHNTTRRDNPEYLDL
jgi:hypothetical protein